MSIQVIINPKAGRGEGKKLWAFVQKKLHSFGLSAQVSFSTSAQEAYHLALRAQDKGCPLILVCGGDGTIHSLIGALVYKPTVLGIIPTGTANDLARHWKIPFNTQRAVELIISGQPQAIDVIATQSGKFIAGAVGLGFDVAVIERAISWRVHCSGIWPFLIAILSAYFHYRLPSLSLTTEKWHYKGPAWQVILTKIDQYARIVKIPSSIKMDDGSMAIFLIPDLSKGHLARKSLLVPFRGLGSIPGVKQLTSKFITVEASPPIKYHGDGELMGMTPEAFQVLPKALRVLMPISAKTSYPLQVETGF